MKSVNLRALIRRTVRRINRIRSGIGAPVYLSIPLNLPECSWRDCSPEKLIERLIHYAALMAIQPEP